ncbi:MAG: biotin-dependent carboxyltransferase family protein [Firmicutes bacterium]|nr:biotin-dependent carboxyltransferase family protein [Bacillota bacterium]
MNIKVISPGVLTTVQDTGRFGHQAAGIPEAGAMDRASLRLANALVGNPEDAAALELTVFGGTFEFDGEGTIALTGADMRPFLNGNRMAMNTAVPVKAGDRLELGAASQGMRAYLAVSGGIDVPVVLGSRSTDLKSRLGGLEGRKLRAGDVLESGSRPQAAAELAEVQGTPCEPVLQRLAQSTDPEGVTRIRFLFGPQDAMFAEDAKKTFTDSIYTLSAACDRMGYRLEGAAVPSLNGTDILSEGICFGSIQVPANGQPIVMMADHQTTGGYAKIGTVLSEDLPLLAQLGPGKRIRFASVTLEELGESL